MSATVATQKQYGLLRQWSLCVLMITAAWLVCAAARISFAGLFASTLSISYQAAVALALSLVACLNAYGGYRLAAHRPVAQHTIESYSRLDLRGWNPVLLAPVAGIGEEILFRGALQSVVGIWLSSALFVLAHARAYRFDTLDRRVFLQAIGLLAMSLILASVTRFAGLLSAIVLHTVIDVTGLYTIRKVAAKGLAPNNSFKPKPLRGSLDTTGEI